MSWPDNNKNNKIDNNSNNELKDASQPVFASIHENKYNDNADFKALVDTAPLITSALASEDGKTITLTFSVSPAPLLPSTDPKFFNVKFDGISVPLINVKRDYSNFLEDCKVATTTAFSTSVTYLNGTSGLGATLTGPQEAISIDSVSLSLNDRVLVKSYVGTLNAPKNGVYRVSTVGFASSTSWVLTRTTDADSSAELKNMTVYVSMGSTSNQGAWQLTTTGSIVIGTTSLNYSKIDNLNAGKQYLINLASPIKTNMNVTLDYFPNVTDNVTNNKNVSPDPMLAIQDVTVDVSSVKFPFGYFDPIKWASNDYDGTIPNGILYERRTGFLAPPITYDTGSPSGDAVLHQSKTKTVDGLNIHYFGCYATNNDTETKNNILTGTYFVQDVFENTVRESSPLGGADDPNEYEIIGNGYNYYLVNYLTPNASGVYPTVKSIEFGLTASSPKNYVLEVKKTISSAWVPLMYMYASNGTQEYFRYVFQTALILYATRLRYRGDYFYTSNSGLVTISAQDTLSGSEAIRVSHFDDFNDAQDFADTFPASELLDPQGEGWIAFRDGTAFYDWDIINRNKIWSEFAIANESYTGNKIFNFGDLLIAVAGTKIYTIDANATVSLVYDAGSTINAFAIHLNSLFLGLQNGNVLKSETGADYASVGVLSGLPPIKCLQSFGRRLWIGTSRDSDGIGYLFNYNGSSRSGKSFGQFDVLSLGKTSNYLFIGLGGDAGSQKGQIYYTNGITYTPIYNTLQDRVDALQYNTGTSELWAGTSDGSIFAFKFQTDGNVKSYSRIIQFGASDSFKFYNFVDSPDGEFFWLVTNRTDGNVMVYNVDFGIYYDTFRPENVYINDVAYLGTSLYGIGSDGKIYLINLNLFSSDEKNVYLQVRDLAGNVNTTAIIDNIIYGKPPATAVTSETPSGKIYQVRIPTVYLYQPTTTADLYTYTTVYKWSSNDSIQVFKSTSGGPKVQITSGFTNLNNGSIIFATIQSVNDKFFITITSPSDGLISLVTEYDSPDPTSALYAPTKTTRQSGIYESEPFYAPSLSRWNELSAQTHIASTPAAAAGEESGLQVDIYVRSANTREECLLADWGIPFTYSTINTTSVSGSIVLNTYSIQSYNGKWIQFKAVLSTASINVSPKLNYVSLSYYSANDTYFFTKRFDTATEYLNEPYPEIRRGLLTYNGAPNGGQIQFKYLTSSTLSDSFDISKYTDITPNTIFDLPTASRFIRFAILLVSAGVTLDPNTAAIVDEFAIQLDTGETDLYWMNPDVPEI